MVGTSEFRDLMAGVPSPVTVLTTHDEGPVGTTIGAFISLSLEPPLVLASLMSHSTMLSRLRRVGRFGVNILAEHQSMLARRFASRVADRFAGVDWVEERGLPRLSEASGWIECELHSDAPGGDHTIVIGRVVAAQTFDARPMVFCERSFGGHLAASTAVWEAH